MVKTAVEELNSTVADNKDHRQTIAASSSGRGAISSLKTRAESFAVTQERVRADEKTYSGKWPRWPTHHRVLLCNVQSFKSRLVYGINLIYDRL